MRPYKLVKLEGDYIIIPDHAISCPFCGHEMLFHDYLVQFASQGFFHADIHLKCSYCGFYATFGIPITSSEYDKLRNSKWHRKIILRSITELYPELKESINERLKSWGYW